MTGKVGPFLVPAFAVAAADDEAAATALVLDPVVDITMVVEGAASPEVIELLESVELFSISMCGE
jgi:hypothetical protein